MPWPYLWGLDRIAQLYYTKNEMSCLKNHLMSFKDELDESAMIKTNKSNIFCELYTTQNTFKINITN